MSQLNVDSIKDRTGANQPDIVGAAKAFVNFNGTGTVTIRNGFNVSSITDNGIGNYNVNFTDAIADANYSIFANCADVGNSYANQQNAQPAPDFTATTSLCKVITGNSISAAYADFAKVFVAIHR